MVRKKMVDYRDSSADETNLVGRWLCLDFTNTLSWRGRKHPKEHLNSYTDLISWCRRVRVLTNDKANQLIKTANRYPSEAEGVFNRAVKLREAIHNIFSAVTNHSASKSADLETLNMELSMAMAEMQMTQVKGCYALTLSLDKSLDCMLWPIARSVADLLTSDKLDRVRKCAAEECGWLFLDKSRNRSRRWCDMKDCGNRAKARRHYDRKRAVSLSTQRG
jgi:predicted RNA-binding Zn ribbon-like protein